MFSHTETRRQDAYGHAKIAMKRIDALLDLFREKTPTLKKQESDNIYRYRRSSLV